MLNVKLYKIALALAVITIIYNLGEGIFSVIFGLADETLSLFGFGIDSFVEVISGVGILHMVLRIKSSGESHRDKFEKTALRITGSGFYILTIGLVVTSIYNIAIAHKPETTLWGIIISSISIVTMWILIHYKLKVGFALNSYAIIADANCTKTCLYLSLVLLFASVGYELTKFGSIDSIGALVIAWFSFKEGKEAFQKARLDVQCSCADEK
jgi:divalent metal cation (Fe/Co/Zn/Cd) transporter